MHIMATQHLIITHLHQLLERGLPQVFIALIQKFKFDSLYVALHPVLALSHVCFRTLYVHHVSSYMWRLYTVFY